MTNVGLAEPTCSTNWKIVELKKKIIFFVFASALLPKYPLELAFWARHWWTIRWYWRSSWSGNYGNKSQTIWFYKIFFAVSITKKVGYKTIPIRKMRHSTWTWRTCQRFVCPIKVTILKATAFILFYPTKSWATKKFSVSNWWCLLSVRLIMNVCWRFLLRRRFML